MNAREPSPAVEILEGFAGPGGFSEAAEMLGLGETLGVEINADACATATAAGHPRLQGDIRALNPHELGHVRGWISGPPCPSYSDAGLRSGRGDYALVLRGSTLLGDSLNAYIGTPAEDAYTDTYAAVADERSALVLETLKFALRLPNLEWLVAEQVPAVERIWWDFAAELATVGWQSCAVVALRADDFGLPTRRHRVILIAARDRELDLTSLPFRAGLAMGRFAEPWTLQPNLVTPFPRTTMAAALGLPPGVRYNTRGDRKTSGGNEFPADRPAPGLTYTARTWYRVDLGSEAGRLEAWQSGLMQGFPADYSWQGARTRQFQQIADSIPTVLGAAALGVATGRPWVDAAWGRLAELYGVTRDGRERVCDGARAAATGQGDLFEAVA